MKKQILIIGSALMLSFASMAQIKVFDDRNVGIHTTSSNWSNITNIGNSIFVGKDTSAVISAPLIRGSQRYSTATTPDITWYGNEQTGFYHPSSNNIGFAIAGVQKMKLSSLGLDITGNSTFLANNTGSITSAAYIRGNNSFSNDTTPDYTWYNNDRTGMFHPANHIIAFTTNSKERIRFNSNGNIGINTTTLDTTSIMRLKTNSTLDDGLFIELAGANRTAYGIKINAQSSYYRGILVSNSTSAASPSNSIWGVGSELSGYNMNAYLCYKTTGSNTFGIYVTGGTYSGYFKGKTVVTSASSPNSTADFEVQNTTSGSGYPATISLRQTNTSGNILSNLNFGDNNTTNAQARIQVIRDGASSSSSDLPTAMIFSTTKDNTSSLTERLRIFNDGNVSIGNIYNWDERLKVIAENFTAFATYVNHTDSFKYGQVSYVNRANSKGLSVIYNSTETFKVFGDGTVWTNAQYTTSDSTLKENIENIQSPLYKVMQLHGVKYNYKKKSLSPDAIENTILASGNPKKRIGLLAQEVESIVPEVVVTDENGVKGISYQDLVALLIESIKEQQTQLETMQQELDKCCTKNTNKSYKPNENTGSNSVINNSEKNTASYLMQNRPNPFSRETVIDYFIASDVTNASIMIFDLNGKLLKTVAVYGTGKGSVTVSSNELNPGMYLYSLVINGNEADTKRMILEE